MLLSRRMIVAAYVKGITLWSTVTPVSRVERLSRQERESRRSPQEESSFAALFGSMVKSTVRDESNGFDLQA